MVQIKSYTIKNNLTLTNELLVNYISQFWTDIFSQFKDNKHLLLMCKVKFSNEDMGYRTLGNLRKVNFNDKELFIDYLSQRLAYLNDSYLAHPISKITFSYLIKEGLCNEDNRALFEDLSDKVPVRHNFNNLNLPATMIPSEYGEVIVDNYHQIDGTLVHRYLVKDGNRNYLIEVSSDNMINKVSIVGNSDISWIDTKINDQDLDIFKREIGKSTVYFMDGEVVLRKQLLPAKPFNILKVDSKITNKFFTMDIETIKNSEGKLIPYLICAYTGSSYITSYNKDPNLLFKSFIDQLLSFKDRYFITIYAHNLSGFDGIFLMKHLLSYGKVDPLLFNGKLISIKVKIEGPNKSDNKILIFKDSYLLLPNSLRKLCEAFKVDNPKSIFPFLLNNIYYSGVFPKFEYWNNLSQSEFDTIKSEFGNKMWSFQLESTKYCKLDCLSLHQVLTKFSELIFNEFKVDIHKVLTLPSLAMKIYKTHYMPKDTIYQLLDKPEFNIRQSYSGGAVDVYIPHNRISAFFSKTTTNFKKLFYYDVNSLYPSVMANMSMPVGKPIVFEGNIRKIEHNAYGFFFCKITTPDNLLHPILQRRIKTGAGVRTIAGLGTWEGWINSSEMDNAIKYGYQFEILNGYQFEQGDIFSEYINKMYSLRKEYSKGTPMNLIAKLLMNSLYGKFGMKLEKTEIMMYDCSTDEGLAFFYEMLEFYGETIQDYIKIDNHYLIIRNSMLSYKYNEELELYHGLEVNIAIASAVTAEARVHMSFFKNNPDFNLYYSDTDSIVIDKELPEAMVGDKLGLVKLEHTIKQAVFLAPKVYGLLDVDGTEIIKVKGINKDKASELNINELELLLVKDSSKEFNQKKWFKKVIEGEITISDVVYTLKVTSNKRAPEYINSDGIEIYNSTRPYYYDEIVS